MAWNNNALSHRLAFERPQTSKRLRRSLEKKVPLNSKVTNMRLITGRPQSTYNLTHKRVRVTNVTVVNQEVMDNLSVCL